MSRKKIENLIPIAMEVIDEQIASHPNQFIKETKGHISSYGPSILMAGLKQTVLFNDKNNAYINTLIFEILKKQNFHQNKSNLIELTIKYNNKTKQQIIDVIVACKLVLPTFDLPDKNKDK